MNFEISSSRFLISFFLAVNFEISSSRFLIESETDEHQEDEEETAVKKDKTKIYENRNNYKQLLESRRQL